MTVKEEVNRSIRLLQIIQRVTTDLKFDGGGRERLATMCFVLVNEHHIGIVKLVESGMYAPALALMRSTFESLVRGLWFQRCATDEQIERFYNDEDLGISTKRMTQDLGGPDTLGLQSLVDSHTKYWKTMCGYAHPGQEILSRMVNEDTVTPNFSEEQVLELLRFVNSYGQAAGVQVVVLANRGDLFAELEAVWRMYRDGVRF